MKHSNRGTLNRVPSRTTLCASVALIGLFAGFASAAVQAKDGSDANACRQQTKRVAVWPKGPRGPKVARFEEREVTVCDGKVTAQRSPEAAAGGKGK